MAQGRRPEAWAARTGREVAGVVGAADVGDDVEQAGARGVGGLHLQTARQQREALPRQQQLCAGGRGGPSQTPRQALATGVELSGRADRQIRSAMAQRGAA